jgi:LacI family transcriptional regulator
MGSIRRRPAVALLIETSNAYGRGLLEGIVSFVREHDSWSLYVPEMRRGEVPPDWLARWRGNAIIARVENRETARAIRRTKLPVVDVSAARLLRDVPWVETDDAAIAVAAAEHLVERGFRRFAYCGDPRFNWSRWRQETFCEAIRARGDSAPIAVFQSPGEASAATSWSREHKRLIAWVRGLTKPIGIMACYDIQAQRLLDACRDADVAVPEEAAVLGVDDDRLLCNLCTPPLSSVVPNAHRTGYMAAELIDRMMRGERVLAAAHLIPPTGVAVRQSTEVLAIDDRAVAAAVRFIREHACEGINAEDVLRQASISRRVLESRFRKALGRTPHAEIMRVRIERVKRLLTETNLTLEAIAVRSGFRHVEYLSYVFHRETGKRPGRYRREEATK